MKGSLPFSLTMGVLLLTASAVVAQNPVLIGNCTGKQLTVTSNANASKIEWIKNGITIEKTNLVELGNPVVVAGKEGIYGSGNDQLAHPKRIFVTSTGDIYIADWANGRVQKWSPPYTTGTTVASGLDWVEDIQVESGGTILVSEHWGQRISRWPGNITVAGIGGADGMAVDAAGRLYVVEFAGHRVYRFPANPSPSAMKTIVAGTGNAGSALNELNYPIDVQVDGNGQIYVMDTDNDRILRFPSNSTMGTTGTVVVSGLGLYYADAFAVDASGTLFITTSSGIQMVEPGSGSARKVSDIVGYGIFCAPGNQVYVSANQCVQRLSLLPPSNTFIPATPGAYTARIYYKDGTVKTSNTVNVQLTPAAPVLTSNSPVCPGNILSLLATSPVPGATYQWTGPLGFSSAAANVAMGGITMAYSGNYMATVTDAFGCVSAPDTITVIVEQPVPSVHITANTVRYFCPGIPVTFTPTPVKGGPAPTYQWKKNGITVGAGATYTTIAVSNGDVFTCVMTSSAPCASPATVTRNAIIMSSSAAPVLNTTASCVGATITVNSPLPLREIAWYRDGAFVENAPNQVNGVTIAGGNGQGAALNQFYFPSDIVKDAAGNLYVTDMLNARILKFPPNSTSLTNGIVVAGGNGIGSGLNQLEEPSGLFVDGSGNLFVADGQGHRVLKFPPGSTSATNGTIVAGGSVGSALNQLKHARDVWVDAAGYIYVVDAGNGRVLKFPPGSTAGTNGVMVAGNGVWGPGLDQLNIPDQVQVDAAGNIYVTEYNNRRVTKWLPGATSGIVVAGGNGWGTDLNQVSYPNGLYVDAGGNVYVSDAMNNRVLKWAPGATSGIIVAGGNGSGAGINQLNNPVGVYVDADEYVYVADGANRRVQKIMPEVETGHIPTVAGSYKAIATSLGGCPATTNDVIIQANNTPTISISTPATTICAGVPVTFTATATYAGTAPVYQWKLNGVNMDTGDSFTPIAPLKNGDLISCELTVAAGAGCVTSNTAISNTITMTVNATMQITIVADNPGPVCPGASPSFTATATGTPTPAYQWQVNGSNTGSNSPAFSPATLNNGDIITCILTGTNGCPASNSVTSNAIIPVVYTVNDTILHVNKNVSGGAQTGLGWSNAITELSDALLMAASCNTIKEIWIAGGVYHPQYNAAGNPPANPREASFHLPTGLRIYGGLHTGYNAASPTDINAIHAGNYSVAVTDSSYLDGAMPGANAYHVATINNAAAGTLLNGLIIRNGRANGTGTNGQGGGLFINGNNAAIAWCTITNNEAVQGGGVYHAGTNAARYNYCTFSDNKAADGGAIYMADNTSVNLVNSTLYNNQAITNGGALYIAANSATSHITNITCYKNTAGNGSAIYHTSGSTLLGNSIVMGAGTPVVNEAGFSQLHTAAPAITPANEAWWFLSVTPGHPDFLRLTNCSPAVNAGDNAVYGSNMTTDYDLAGSPRLQQGTIDQGAYESSGMPLTITQQPIPAVVCTPVDTAFSIQVASNTTISYQWQIDKNDGNGFIDSTGATASTLHIIHPGTGQNGWRYRAYIKHCPFTADTTAIVPLTVHALPAMQSITGNQQVCTGKITQLNNTTAGATFIWKSLDASIATINTAGQVQGIKAGNTAIRYIVTTAVGCTDSVSANITVHPLPSMQPITGVQLLCANSSMQLGNATTGAAGYWKSTNPTVATIDMATGRVTGVGGGVTTIRYIATNAAGCADSAEAVVTVHNLPSVQPIIAATGDFKLCEQATLLLHNQTNSISGSWKTLDNAVAIINAGGQVTGITAGNTTARFIAVGINGTGCTDSTDVAITVLPTLPTAINITISGQEICAGETVTFKAYTTNGGVSPGYQWMLNNQPASSHTNAYASSTLKDGDIVSCVLQSTAACASPAILPSAAINMTVHPQPVVQPVASHPAIFKGDQLQLNAGITGPADHIQWKPGIGLSNDTVAAPLARPAVTTMYEVQVSTQYGCTASGQLMVTVMEKQDIPNAFSPNGDGINDRWEIRYLDKFTGASVQVFNRYGQPVYSATSYQPGNGWDGRLKGQPLPMGTYYYIIDLKNGFEKLSGSISIIK